MRPVVVVVALTVAGALAAAPDDAGSRDHAPTPATRAVLGAAAPETPSVLGLVEASHAEMPRPYRKRLDGAVAANARCVSCHPEEAAEWGRSRHRSAATNSAFTRAVEIEPSPFCRGCHAPEGDPEVARASPAADLGVGCVTCHVVHEGSVSSGPKHAPGEEDAPHAVLRSRDFAGAAGCAGCHEFRFPSGEREGDEGFMQTTVREHARSERASTACAGCHMPREGERRSHTFDEPRDPGFLRAHLHADAVRTSSGIQVKLEQSTPAHGFPTGDLFRRLEVGYEIRREDGTRIAGETRDLARHFVAIPGELGRRLVRDDRVFDEPRTVEFELPSDLPARAHVAWWVTYQRVASVGAGTDPKEATIESEVPLARGDLP